MMIVVGEVSLIAIILECAPALPNIALIAFFGDRPHRPATTNVRLRDLVET